MQWWEYSPPTNVAWFQILASTPYAGWVCSWFSPSLREVLLLVLLTVFPSLHKLTFPNSKLTRNEVDEEPLSGCTTILFYIVGMVTSGWLSLISSLLAAAWNLEDDEEDGTASAQHVSTDGAPFGYTSGGLYYSTSIHLQTLQTLVRINYIFTAME